MTPLRERFIQDLQVRNRAPDTIEAYVHQVARWSNPEAFAAWLARGYETDWVVYVEPPDGRDPSLAFKYLARYVYRVAISNDRLESIEDGQVTFRYKDYAVPSGTQAGPDPRSVGS